MDTVLVIIGAIVAIVCIVAIYYLLKLLIAYILSAILGGVIFGVVSVFFSGYLYPKEIMLDVMVCSAGVGAVIGLVLSILATKEWIKEPLATAAVKEIFKDRDPIGTEYTVRDQYGNTRKVRKTGGGVLGETYLEDEFGNHMVREACDDEVRYQ